MRLTIRLGSRGPDVAAWQRHIGVTADGVFGPMTEAATRAWQSKRGLVADGIVGAKSWTLAGETWGPSVQAGDPRSPAAVAALRDANAAWPGRKKASDGIIADQFHASTSDHARGLAVDITHDSWGGCDGAVLAEMATSDARVTYVIWNARIWSAARAAEGWRKYTGKNPHRTHVHISLREDRANDAGPWPWAP